MWRLKSANNFDFAYCNIQIFMFIFSVCIMSDDEEDEVGFKGTIHFNINLDVKSKAAFHYNNSKVLMAD